MDLNIKNLMMSISDFFSKQAQKPSGWFGRLVMPVVFDRGNAFLNNFVNELLDVQPDERVLEIGCGTGKLVKLLADGIETGQIEGVDFSSSMVKIAQKRNRGRIAEGIVNIVEKDFDEYMSIDSNFSKACTVNTIYFWKNPKRTVKKVFRLLSPGGCFIVAFEDIDQLLKRNLSTDVFKFYNSNEVIHLLQDCGFEKQVHIASREKHGLLFHCAVARK